MHHKVMIREGSFIGRPSAKETCVPALPLHIDHGEVPDPPVLRGPRAVLQHVAKSDAVASSQIPLAANGRPDAQVVHELEQLEVGAVAHDWGEHLPDEAAFDSPLPADLNLRRLFFCIVVTHFFLFTV